MAENTKLITKILMRNDTASNWTSANPVLSKGEIGVETDTRKLKIGDGVTKWNTLKYIKAEEATILSTDPTSSDSSYDVGSMVINSTNKKIYICVDNTPESAVWKRIVTPEDLADLGAGDMLKEVFATQKAEEGYVDKAVLADTATKLTTPVNIKLTGDVTGTVSFDGSTGVQIASTLKNSGVSGGTYTKLTVDKKGIVTAGKNLSESDIPNISYTKVTGLGTVATLNTGIASGNVPVLNESGKLDDSIIPSLAIGDVFEVSSEGEMIALSSAQKGDIAIRSDVNKTFILKANPYSTADNWVELKTPTDAVLSVNGETGAVTLNTDKISEGSSNLYYTDERATQNFNTNIAKANSTSLADSATLLRTTDTFIIDGGNASGASE